MMPVKVLTEIEVHGCVRNSFKIDFHTFFHNFAIREGDRLPVTGKH